VAENIPQDRGQDNSATAFWRTIQRLVLILIRLDAGLVRLGSNRAGKSAV